MDLDCIWIDLDGFGIWRNLNGFEWFSDPYDGKNPDLQWGNIMVNLNGYKFTKTFGEDRIAYMSKEYALILGVSIVFIFGQRKLLFWLKIDQIQIIPISELLVKLEK